MENKNLFKTGQKPGIGEYHCNSCGKILFIEKIKSKLPPCAKCQNIYFIKK